jgi:hypothetical protein
MRKLVTAICAATAALVICSCGTVYSRVWAVNAQNLTDTLSISGDSFRLERSAREGTSSFEGKFEEKGERWIFDITSWKPANATIRRFDPPVRYIYNIHKFSKGVSFLSLVEVVGKSTFQFIQNGDFQIR